MRLGGNSRPVQTVQSIGHKFMARFHPYWLWLVLAIPAIGFTGALINSSDPKIIGELLHPTGEFSARFLIIAMLASPLALVFKGRAFPAGCRKTDAILAWQLSATHCSTRFCTSSTRAQLVPFYLMPRTSQFGPDG